MGLDGYDSSRDDPGYCGECYVESITIGGKLKPSITHARFGINWVITFKGSFLTRCEFTQFISAFTTMYDINGTEMSKADIYKSYKSRFTPAGDPFANNQKDDGWGNGANWKQFGNDTLQIYQDHHIINVPWYGDPKQYYAFK